MKCKNQRGRSMVEMLGVLAVIGVLSAGALAGYSKAMMQHRLNVQQEQITQIVTAVTRYQNDLYGNNASDILSALKEVPEAMIKSNGSWRDAFLNQIRLKSQASVLTLFIYLNGAKSSSIAVSRQCQNLLMIAKNFSSELYYVETLSGYNTDDERRRTYQGDRWCATNDRCLKNITVSDIKSMCALHQGAKSTMELKFWWAKNS